MSGQMVEIGGGAEPVPYRRGIPAVQVVKGALSRFLPGSILGTGALAVIFDISARGGDLVTAGIVVALAGGMTLGFGSTLLAMKRWLYPDARPDRSRSFLAGVLAPLATFAGLAAGIDFAYLPGLSVAMGAVVAMGLFFAWLAPTPSEKRDPGLVDDVGV